MNSDTQAKHVAILGIRGVPAAHGGFETFAHNFALYLVNQGVEVTVYCQINGSGPIYTDSWQGVNRVNIPVKGDSALATIIFDWKCVWHARKHFKNLLCLGYNTAVFNVFLRGGQRFITTNMDGIEWMREKWGFLPRLWLRLNELAGAKLSHHLIADHPEIGKHLENYVKAAKITVIPYGSEPLNNPNADLLTSYNLQPHRYALLIARPEPENNIFEIVVAWSKQNREIPLVILGNYQESNHYHVRVRGAATENVLFLGAIYDPTVVANLRYFARFYIHGHKVGGTNPSLVESLASYNPVLAHDNKFTRWVAQDAGLYFADIDECSELISQLLSDDDLIAELSANAKARYESAFTFEQIHTKYLQTLSR